MRATGRATQGVIGIRLREGENDAVVSMALVPAADRATGDVNDVTGRGRRRGFLGRGRRKNKPVTRPDGLTR